MHQTESESTPSRRLRLFLRDHRFLDADARVPEGQQLSTYLATRTRYVNLTDGDWLGTGDRVPHMALKVARILWASSRDGGLPLTTSAAAEVSHRVEIELEGGYVLAAGLLLLEDQRLTDYLQTAPPFVPLRDAELRPRRKHLGDVAVNQECIQLVREVPDPATEEAARGSARGTQEPRPGRPPGRGVGGREASEGAGASSPGP